MDQDREPAPDPLLHARALLLHDLGVCGIDVPHAVDVVDDVVSERRWWVESWPEGAAYVAGQIAQDVQDRLLDATGHRWPPCPRHATTAEAHELRIAPELGPLPQWVCETVGERVAPLGALGPMSRR